MLRRTSLFLAAFSALSLGSLTSSASAETIAQALASAYQFNPEINSARAETRAIDENVPIAKSALRPTVAAVGDLTQSVSRSRSAGIITDVNRTDLSLSLQVEQLIFAGFRTRNAILEAEAGVLGSRALLRNTVQNVLYEAAEAYMDVLRDIELLDIRRRNVIFLQEQVRAAQDRFNVGEATRTDIAQARAVLAVSQAEVSLAEASLQISIATYRQYVGHDPENLQNGFPYGRHIPGSLEGAIAVAQNDHPGILAAIFQSDAAGFEVKQIEGELLPTVSVTGSVGPSWGRDWENDLSDRGTAATIGGRISIPLFQGGAVSARVRQAKEYYGRAKIEVDLIRDQVRLAVVSAWAQREAAVGAIEAASTGVEAANIVLSGVQEEQSVGLRTTLDVLNAQEDLLEARIILILAQRDQVVASYALLAAMGRLTAEQLSLPTPVYDPAAHYLSVRNQWYGTRTPDGR